MDLHAREHLSAGIDRGADQKRPTRPQCRERCRRITAFPGREQDEEALVALQQQFIDGNGSPSLLESTTAHVGPEVPMHRLIEGALVTIKQRLAAAGRGAVGDSSCCRPAETQPIDRVPRGTIVVAPDRVDRRVKQLLLLGGPSERVRVEPKQPARVNCSKMNDGIFVVRRKRCHRQHFLRVDIGGFAPDAARAR